MRWAEQTKHIAKQALISNAADELLFFVVALMVTLAQFIHFFDRKK